MAWQAAKRKGRMAKRASFGKNTNFKALFIWQNLINAK
jgi:hypothetical protein